MGKDKSKKRRKSDDSSDTSVTSDSSSDSEREEARREKKRKKHKKDKDKSKKDKSSKHKSSKDDLIKQARAFLEQHLAAGGGGGGGAGGPGGIASGSGAGPPSSAPFHGSDTAGAGPLPPVQVAEVKEPIGDEDYFARHAEFSAFLAQERRTQFNDLSSDRARELFSEFVTIWNEGRLAPRYYAGLVAAPKRRTEYLWNFGARGGQGQGGLAAAAAAGAVGGAGPSTGMAAFVDDQRAQQAGARQESRRQDRARARELLEDVAPRETGRDKMVAERAARRELARSRDDDGPGGFLPGGRGGEDDLLGGGDSFEAAKAREARRAEAARQRGVVRMEETAQRAAAYQAKEDEKLAGLRALLAKGPITIAKRS